MNKIKVIIIRRLDIQMSAQHHSFAIDAPYAGTIGPKEMLIDAFVFSRYKKLVITIVVPLFSGTATIISLERMLS